MAKIVVVCLRNPAPAGTADVANRLRRFLASLCPDNLTPAKPIISTDGRGMFLGVHNPADPSAVHDCSAYSGWLENGHESWWRPGAPAPSGTYALLRGNAGTVEALADYAASRTIWIAQTDDIFIASTSQRAIPYFLGSFEPNPAAIAWMLSAGTLGPSAGWDRRAHPLGPDGSARLERANWRLTIREPPVEFRVDPSPDEVHAQRLRDALEETVGNLSLDHSRWVLPLSGGVDSRAILLMMKNRRGLRTVTWGRKDALKLPGNDAFIARQVAAAVGVENQYYATDVSDEPAEKLVERFLIAGDGRTAGVLGYVDGFRTWRSFFESGVRGVVRGEHGFGPGPAPAFTNYAEVLHFLSITRWRDHASVPSFGKFGMPHLDDQSWPESFEANSGESPEDWRDRLYQLYRIPAYHAAQSDLKAAYVEIASPLLVRRILELTRSHPLHLRNAKKLFADVMAPKDVPVRYAIESALVKQQQILANPSFLELLRDELTSRRLRNVFTAAFADFLLAALSRAPAESLSRGLMTGPRRRLRLLMSAQLRSRLRRKPKGRSLDLAWVAMRACIACRMIERLAIDAQESRRAVADDRPAPGVTSGFVSVVKWTTV